MKNHEIQDATFSLFSVLLSTFSTWQRIYLFTHGKN